MARAGLGRRGMSTPVLVAVLIVAVFSGRYAWLKYRTTAWLEQTEPALSRTRERLIETLKSASYPAFAKGSEVVPLRGKDKGLVIAAEALEEGEDAVASIHASERTREVARWLVTTQGATGSCHVVLHRLYLDSGKPYGKLEQCLAPLYLETRAVDVPGSDIGSLKKRLDAATGDHTKLVASVARVRLRIPRAQLNGALPPVSFQVLCHMPEDAGISREALGTAEVQVTVSFEAPAREKPQDAQ